MNLNFTQMNKIIEVYNEKIKNLEASNISIQTSIKFAKLLQEFEVYQNTYNQRLNSIIQKYGEKDENGDFVYLNEERTIIKWMSGVSASANKELQELYNFELDINTEPFSADELEEIKKYLTIQELVVLSILT